MNEFSEAIVIFLGFGIASSPLKSSDRLAQHFGTTRGAALESEISPLLRELDTIKVDWSAHTLASASDFVRAEMRRRHPELSEAALSALAWKFSFDWR